MDYAKLRGILGEMQELLAVAGWDGQVAYVRRLIALGSDDPQLFREALLADDMWGGSGAVWEVNPLASREAEKRFAELLVRLSGEMDRAGICDERASDVANIMRLWLESDVWSRIPELTSPAPRPRKSISMSTYVKGCLERRPGHVKGPEPFADGGGI